MTERHRRGGLASWSIRRPIGVSMLALAIVVPGLIALYQLSIDLLPQLIYPNIRVRVLETGVPARIMEDQITRHLEESLAATEGAVEVESFTRQGLSLIHI